MAQDKIGYFARRKTAVRKSSASLAGWRDLEIRNKDPAVGRVVYARVRKVYAAWEHGEGDRLTVRYSDGRESVYTDGDIVRGDGYWAVTDAATGHPGMIAAERTTTIFGQEFQQGMYLAVGVAGFDYAAVWFMLKSRIVEAAFEDVISAAFVDRLNGELTLSATTTVKRVKGEELPEMLTGRGFLFRGLWYDIVRTHRSIATGAGLVTFDAEHESLALADMELESFEYSGAASGALARVLDGTRMSAGYVEQDPAIEVNFRNTVSRRRVLLEIAGRCGGELVYSGHTVSIAAHRGRRVPVDLQELCRCTDFAERLDLREGTAVYDVSGIKPDDARVGDEVRIDFAPLGIAVQRRIVGMSYNPYNCTEVSIEIGDYVPQITDDYIDAEDTADEALKKAEDVETNLKEELTGYLKSGDLRASLDKYVDSATGRASIAASLSGTFAKQDALGKYVAKTELSAEIGAYIDTQAGTAKIINNLSGTFAKQDALGKYVAKTELNAGIASYIDTAAGKSQVVTAVSGTYVESSTLAGTLGSYAKKSDLPDVSGFIKKTELSAEIGAYIDTAAGTAKIKNNLSGTYLTKSDLSGYVQTSVLTSIEQSIKSTEAKISLTSAYGSGTIGSNVRALLTLVSNADSSSIKLKADAVEIDGTLYLKASDYLVSGTTTIKGSKIQTSDLYLQSLRTSAGDYIVSYTGGNLTIGGMYQGANVAEFGYVDIMARDGIRFGYVGYSCVLEEDVSGFVFRPYRYPNQLKIGTSVYPVGEIRCDALYVGGKAVTGSSSESSSALKATDITRLYTGYSSYNYLELNASGQLIPNGSTGDIGSSTKPFTTVYVGSSTYHWKITQNGIIPSRSTTLYFDIGSASYPVYRIYAQEIYLNGTKLTTGSTGSGSSSGGYAGSLLKMGGSTSYYIQATTSRELCPNTSATYYPFYLGTSVYYWHYAYIGSVAAYIGKTASSKIGFFGATPVARQTVSSSASVATLISVLKSYGLIY